MILPILVQYIAATDPKTGLPIVNANQGQVNAALQIVFGIIGAVAVILIVIAGFSFITSQGDPQATAKARQTIIYSVVGLLVAISAEIIVTFVINKI